MYRNGEFVTRNLGSTATDWRPGLNLDRTGGRRQSVLCHPCRYKLDLANGFVRSISHLFYYGHLWKHECDIRVLFDSCHKRRRLPRDPSGCRHHHEICHQVFHQRLLVRKDILEMDRAMVIDWTTLHNHRPICRTGPQSRSLDRFGMHIPK